MAKYNADEILDLIEEHKLKRHIQLMGEASMVVQGYQKTCEIIEALPLDRWAFPHRIEKDLVNKDYYFEQFVFNSLDARPLITTPVDGVQCQIRESYESDKTIHGSMSHGDLRKKARG